MQQVFFLPTLRSSTWRFNMTVWQDFFLRLYVYPSRMCFFLFVSFFSLLCKHLLHHQCLPFYTLRLILGNQLVGRNILIYLSSILSSSVFHFSPIVIWLYLTQQSIVSPRNPSLHTPCGFYLYTSFCLFFSPFPHLLSISTPSPSLQIGHLLLISFILCKSTCVQPYEAENSLCCIQIILPSPPLSCSTRSLHLHSPPCLWFQAQHQPQSLLSTHILQLFT